MVKLFFYVIVFAVGFIFYVRYLEAKTLFYPTKGLTDTPKAIQLSFEEIYFITEDSVKLHGWFIPYSPKSPTILFMHGNAGNISDRLGKISIFHALGLNVFIFDYRGYGNSSGHPTEKGMYMDARAAYDYLKTRNDIDSGNIVAYGASLGGAAVIDLAVHRSLRALVIDSSFSNAVDMAKRYYPFIPSFLINIKLENDKKIRKISVPVLFFHSQADETVPYSLGKKLFQNARNPKRFVTMKGGHNDSHIEDLETFCEGINQFLKEFNI